LNNAIKKLFVDIPDLYAIRWTQYTPYFNDGDACIFGVGDVSFVSKVDANVVANNIDDIDGVNWEFNSFSLSKYQDDQIRNRNISEYRTQKMKLYCKYGEAFNKFLHNIPKDMMLSAYGDHVSITVTTVDMNIIIEEYDHE
jgi:hypothetical protein